MTNTIKVQIKNIYGNDNIYVISSHKDAIFTLTGRKTITKKDVQALKDLGFTFEVVNESVTI